MMAKPHLPFFIVLLRQNCMRRDPVKLAFAAFSVLISLAFFLLVLGAALPAIAKFALSVVAIGACGMTLMLVFNLEGWGGLYLLRSRKGLDFIDMLAKKHPRAWQIFSEIGMVVGYGSFAHFLIKKRTPDWKRFALVYGTGTVLLMLFSTVIAPLSVSSLLSMLSGGSEFASAGAKVSASISQFELAKYAFLALLVLGGLAVTTTFSIVAYAAGVAWAIMGAVLGNPLALSQTAPGGVPILPGINLPFAEGVAALIVVLAVHEGMHGILARKHGLPLKSAGLVFFGFIPFGAFVDIDEKKLFKEKKEVQNSVFVAGTAANFATCIFFLLLLMLTVAITEPLRVSGVYVVSGSGAIPEGVRIDAINGMTVNSLIGLKLKPDSVYAVKTDAGEFKKKTDAQGKLGIAYVVADKSGTFGAIKYARGFEWIPTIIRFLVLTFALNFIVAAMNLVPLPLFDGYHLMKNGVKNELVQKAIVYIISAAFLLTLFPWVLR